MFFKPQPTPQQMPSFTNDTVEVSKKKLNKTRPLFYISAVALIVGLTIGGGNLALQKLSQPAQKGSPTAIASGVSETINKPSQKGLQPDQKTDQAPSTMPASKWQTIDSISKELGIDDSRYIATLWLIESKNPETKCEVGDFKLETCNKESKRDCFQDFDCSTRYVAQFLVSKQISKSNWIDVLPLFYGTPTDNQIDKINETASNIGLKTK